LIQDAKRAGNKLSPPVRLLVRAFQRAKGLVVDGICGPRTEAAIEEALLMRA